MGGYPKSEQTQPLPDFPYASFGESLGLKGIRVKSPDKISAVWDLNDPDEGGTSEAHAKRGE